MRRKVQRGVITPVAVRGWTGQNDKPEISTGLYHPITKANDMKTVKVEFTVNVDDDVTEDEIGDWVKYELGVLGGISLKNPLCDQDLEANFISVIDIF